MSHVTDVNKSCHAHMSTSHDIDMNKARDAYTHTHTHAHTHTHTRTHTHTPVAITHIKAAVCHDTSHVTHMNELCHICE